MQDKIMDLLKNGKLMVPKILLANYKELKITENDLIVLIYLLNCEGNEFNPTIISKELNIPMNDVLTIIEHLTDINILRLQNKKIDGIIHEFIDLSNLYEKLIYLIINEEKEDIDNSIYSVFEREFGRTLAPMEYEIINGWLDAKYSEELILKALKEAVYNGVFKLNYVDKILYEWNKKGIKTPKDIEVEREKHNRKKEEKKELYDYNWLEEYE